ncbi:MAG: hypothetical protein J5867_08575 [Prevotella sp.]|nr:hypothetical protein [Prevotella sp.]
MDKYFICLANSYKRGGRCIAGIEIAKKANGKWKMIRNQEGAPQWIRPIANTPYGEIPIHVANDIKLLSVIKLVDVQPCPHNAHTEDTLFSHIECCHFDFPNDIDVLNRILDPIHQAIFHNRGRAISTQMITGLNYSLMLIHPENIQTYIDETREKSKYRMSFTYFGTNYDFPITDPLFLDRMRETPQLYSQIDNAYLTLSLGMEFEGWHHKLVAGVIIPKIDNNRQQLDVSKTTIEVENSLKKSSTDWFNDYEKELVSLLEMKETIEEKILLLRNNIQQEMKKQGMEKVESQHFIISYTPAKTIMQFDSRSFRQENEELYNAYCKIKQRKETIVIKKNNKE